MANTYPFTGHCARCEDTGVTYTQRTSPISGLPTDYVTPCACTRHGQPMQAMINRRFQNREGTDILTSNGVDQHPAKDVTKKNAADT